MPVASAARRRTEMQKHACRTARCRRRCRRRGSRVKLALARRARSRHRGRAVICRDRGHDERLCSLTPGGRREEGSTGRSPERKGNQRCPLAVVKGLLSGSLTLMQKFRTEATGARRRSSEIAASTLPMVPRFRISLNLGRRHKHDAPGCDVDLGSNRCGERQQQRLAARGRDLQEIAGAEIVDRDDGAERIAVAVLRREADQVGVIVFVRRGRRQTVARDEEIEIAKPLGAVAVGDAGDAGDEGSPCPPAPRRFRSPGRRRSSARRSSRPPSDRR